VLQKAWPVDDGRATGSRSSDPSDLGGDRPSPQPLDHALAHALAKAPELAEH